MFLGVLLKEGTHFELLFKKLLENKPRNPTLGNIPSIRYRII